ncbi:MAG: DUF3179 domain-containing protein [Chloroflexi bacterium]|nr:DUF3179 domain-containing protein [Chloroflexota bacterium]
MRFPAIRPIGLAMAGLIAAGLLATACFGGDSAPKLIGRGLLGGTDTDKLNVPLEDIHVDTFVSGSVPLSEIDEVTLLALRDAIPPIDNPPYTTAGESGWLGSNDLILGYVADGGQAYAYPTRILDQHEIVNDELGGRAVLISFCPLCRSGIVYDRSLDGRLLSFGNTSALYESDLVMYDRETLSYWFQVGGEAIVGELTGARLVALPSVTTTWDQWRELHPGTLVLSRDLGFARDYSRDITVGLEELINGGTFPFPVTDAARDARLEPAALVLGVERGDDRRAYVLEQLGDAAINDTLGGERIAVFSRSEGPVAAAFLAEADGQALTFRFRDGAYVDEATGSEWSLTGEALSGELAGAQLEPLAVRTAFWFSYVSAFPDVDLYKP